MKVLHKIAFSSFFLLGAVSLSAQTYDQVSNGAGYTQQAYYHFSTGTSVNVPTATWDLGFSAIGQMDAAVHLNESSSSTSTNPSPALEIYVAPTTDFSVTIDANSLIDRVYNPETSWEEGALNTVADITNPFDMGWGDYNVTTHIIEGSRVFVAKLRDGNYQKFIVESLIGGIYTLKTANLDGSNPQTFQLDKANANGSPLLYFSFTNGIINSMPTSWDVVFERYTTDLIDPSTGDPIPYQVLGGLSGKGVSVAKASHIDPQTVTFVDYQDSLSTKLDAIGYDWKSFSGTAWSVASDRAYFVKTADNHVWKVVFIDFEGSSTGVTTFEKTDLGVINTVNSSKSNEYQYLAYPTVTSGEINVALQGKKIEPVSLILYSIDGKKVWEMNTEIHQELNVLNIQLPALSEGAYHLALKTAHNISYQSLLVSP